MSYLLLIFISISFVLDYVLGIRSLIYYIIKGAFLLGNFDFIISNYLGYNESIEIFFYNVLTLTFLPFFFNGIKPKNPKFLISKNILTFYSLVVIIRLYCFINDMMYGTLAGTHLPLVWFDNILGAILNSGLLFIVFGELNKRYLFICFLEAAWIILSGSKLGVIIMLLIIVLRYNPSFKRRYIAYFFISLFVLPTVFSLARYSRVYIQNRKQIDISKVSIDMLTQNKLEGRELIERLSTAYYLDNIISYKKKHVYIDLDNDRFILPLVWFVPRIMWSNKPRVSYGDWVGKNVYSWSTNTRSEQAVTFFGDLYLAIGILSFLIYPILLMFIGRFLVYLSSNHSYVIFYSLSQILTIFEGNVSVLLVNLFQNLLLTIVVYKLIQKLKLWRII